jgi:hypothetical protein
LLYTNEELAAYTDFRKTGLSKGSIPWINKSRETYWNLTSGIISKERLEALRNYLLEKYVDLHAQRKIINFACAFLRYLSKTRFDARYQVFELYLELPKALKERKHVTSRVVTKEDIENVLTAIERAFSDGEIDSYHFLNYRAIVLFGAFSGQRPLATIARLTAGHFREALKRDKPVLDIPPECDKIRMAHYCPIHPQAVDAIIPLLDGRSDNASIFEQLSFARWLRARKIPLIHANTHFLMSDLRKFTEQASDILQWDPSNKNYILTHNVAGVDWRFYKSPRAEPVYDVYMQYWKDMRFAV